MSWIQQFFEKFKKEEELDEDHQLHRNIPSIKQEGRKEMDTRITYQYPKGHFRFPVIPDKKPLNQSDESVNSKKQHAEHKNSNYKSSAGNSRTASKKESLNNTRKYSSGPFRPTEIPSPIFGFNRPKKSAVEHELSHFSKKLFENNESPEKSIDQNKEINEVLYSLQEDMPSDNPFIKEKSPDKNESEVAAIISENTYSQFKEETSSQILNVLLEEQGETVLAANEIETISIAEDEPADEQIHMAFKAGEAETAAAAQEQGETVLAANEIETISIAEDEPADEQTVFTVDEAETSAFAADELIEVKADFNPVINETKPEIQSEQSTSMNTEQNHSEIEKTKKPHLPFNVLMLKSDKQKWAEKNMQRSEFIQPPVTNAAAKEVSFIEERPEQASVEYGPGSYEFPAFRLLKPPVTEAMDTEWLIEQERLLNQTLENFNVGAKVVNVTQGPSVTRFEVHPEPGVKVNKVTNLTDDIKLSLAARDIRIEAPIPGKHTIGIEVPNQKSRPVLISEIIQSKVFCESASPLTAVLGLDISGKPIVTDLKKMPHGLIAGATGSGKSVCINTILISLLYKARPEDLKLLLIDPKMVELAPYNQIPHLVSPVITDVKAATAALKWAVDEMERRYELFVHAGVRDINRFNEIAMKHKRYSEKLPYIVIVIDELADLMMMSPADVEEAICRIAQKARACGIHLIIATQRPSVDVITGLIKANIPTRIAFSVSSQVDSRTIIDISGAERLLGRGDMLFLENGSSKPVRLQGTFVSDEEIDYVVEHVREQREPDYLFEQDELLKKAQVSEEEDELFYEACEYIVDQNCASTSSLQRRFKIGYNRAARLMDLLEQQGYISGARGSKPRDVLITEADLETIQEASS